MLRNMLAANQVRRDFKNWNDNLGYDPERHRKLAALFGLSSTKNLFPTMKLVTAVRDHGVIGFSPSWRKRGDEFMGRDETNPETADVIVSDIVSDEELGAAIRTAFARCSG